MGGEENGWGLAPTVAPLNYLQREEHWSNFDNSVNAVSFGFVATAILISMFLVMAIFERFLRPSSSPGTTPSSDRSRGDLESQPTFPGKLGHPSPKMSVYARGVSVLMPGDNMPTYIAHPAPPPCPPERVKWPLHSQPNPSSNLNSQ